MANASIVDTAVSVMWSLFGRIWFVDLDVTRREEPRLRNVVITGICGFIMASKWPVVGPQE